MTASLPPVENRIAGLRAAVCAWRAAGETVGLVPTMGALHAGHLSLVRAARSHCDRCVVSVFVNPTQFAPDEDFDQYPRRLETDRRALATERVDLVYAPTAAEMYPSGFATQVSVGGVSEGLCGGSRPHFFAGVATVVAKLLIQAEAGHAFFGEKDYQQLQVIRRLARDLDLPVEITGCPTVREADGLALSSRNQYLSPSERAVAPTLYRVMADLAQRLRGSGADPTALLARGRDEIEAAGFRLDYLELRDADTLAAFQPERPGRLLMAAWLGETRLIDNVAV